MYTSKISEDIKLDNIEVIEYYHNTGLYAYELRAAADYVLYNSMDLSLFDYDFKNGKKIVKKNFYYYNKVILTINHKLDLLENAWIAVKKEEVPSDYIIEI